MFRLAHLVTHPIQYFAPLYRELSSLPGIDLTVLFGSKHGLQPSYDIGFGRSIQFDVPLIDGYEHQFLRNVGLGNPTGRFRNFDCPELPTVLASQRFDAVWIHGWGYRFQWQAIDAARKLHLPYMIRSETTLISKPYYSLRWLAARLRVGRMLRQAQLCLYVGKSNRAFYSSMGVKDHQLHPAHYSIDTHAFSSTAGSIEARKHTRSLFGTSLDDFVVVCVAKAVGIKRLQDAISAIGRLGSKAHLWIVGDGPLRPRLEVLGNQLAPGRIHWLGFINQSQIPQRIGAADVFVMSSQAETWGLVVNEAMACGLPVICSSGVGCAADLVRPGDTGFLYPVGDCQALSKILSKMQTDRANCQRMGQAAKQLVSEAYDVHITARQIAEAVRNCI